MRVAVVGGGVFGCTAAVELALAGAKVDVFDAKADILDGATATCQGRLHHGYHYPRSDTTAAAARDAAPVFARRYAGAIRTARHHYVVAEGSKVSAGDYLAFCDRLGLPYEVVPNPPQVHHAQVCIRVPEAFVDAAKLRRLLRRDLAHAGVTLRLGQYVEPGPVPGYDLTVLATYGQPWPRPLRYEVCEVAYVQLGRYGNESFVVIDGDYTSLDPTPSNAHMLYDAQHSVHAANVGYGPEIPAEYKPLLDRPGPLFTPLSRFAAMTQSAGRFLAGLDPGGRGVSIHAGSRYTVRAVLPDADATDERPTLIERDGNVIYILAGKICTAVDAAQTVAAMAFMAVPA